MERKTRGRDVRLLLKIQKVLLRGRYQMMGSSNVLSHEPNERQMLEHTRHMRHTSRKQMTRHSQGQYRGARPPHQDGTPDQRLTVVPKPGHKLPWLTSQSSARGAGSPAMESFKSTTAPRSSSLPQLSRGSVLSRSSCCFFSELLAAALLMQASSDQSISPAQSSKFSGYFPCRHRRISGSSSCRKGYVLESPMVFTSAQRCPSLAHTSSASEHWSSASPPWDHVPVA